MPEDDIFKDDSTIPESNWFKFVTIGDSIQGILVEEPRDQEGKFGMQKIYTIQKPDGQEFMVSLKHTSNKRQIQQLSRVQIGDVLGFRYAGDYDTKKGNPGKSIEVRIKPGSGLLAGATTVKPEDVPFK